MRLCLYFIRNFSSFIHLIGQFAFLLPCICYTFVQCPRPLKKNNLRVSAAGRTILTLYLGSITIKSFSHSFKDAQLRESVVHKQQFRCCIAQPLVAVLASSPIPNCLPGNRDIDPLFFLLSIKVDPSAFLHHF